MIVKVLARSSARSIAAAVVATLFWLPTAGTVNAALFLILTPESGPPGTEVTGQTGGQGTFRSAVGPLQTYLVEEADADGVASPADPALVDIGQLTVDGEGNGSIRFVVPDLVPGAYVVIIHCPPCAEFSGGGVMAAVASFEVTAEAPDTAMLDRSALPAAPVVAGGLLLLGAILIAASRRLPTA